MTSERFSDMSNYSTKSFGLDSWSNDFYDLSNIYIICWIDLITTQPNDFRIHLLISYW